jgi:hypothetical protein
MLQMSAVTEELVAYDPSSKQPLGTANRSKKEKTCSIKSQFLIYDIGMQLKIEQLEPKLYNQSKMIKI